VLDVKSQQECLFLKPTFELKIGNVDVLRLGTILNRVTNLQLIQPDKITLWHSYVMARTELQICALNVEQLILGLQIVKQVILVLT
jgi:hypothetical protein